MYSFSINIDSQKSCYLDYIKNNTFHWVVNAGGFQRLTEEEGRHFLEISVEDDFKQRVGLGIKSAVAEVISQGFKTDYIGEKLSFLSDTLLNRTLVNAMSIFDSSIDRKIAYGVIDNLQGLSIDGLFAFKLGKLKKRWDEIAEITGANGVIFYDDSIKTEFLQYLIRSLNSFCDRITLDITMHGCALYDANGSHIDGLTLLKAEEFTSEEELLFNLVNLAPAYVEITGDKSFVSEEFLCIVKELFGEGIES